VNGSDEKRDESKKGSVRYPRVGQGVDVHPFAEGRKLILGGVHIPFEKGLMGHSDADAVVHALCDALLGSCGLGDIGRHFPPSDPAYQGMDSLFFLSKIVSLVREKGYVPYQTDITILAERPRMAPHVSAMQKILSPILGVLPEDVAIKATTTEKMGFTGREEGIVAMAVVTVVPL